MLRVALMLACAAIVSAIGPPPRMYSSASSASGSGSGSGSGGFMCLSQMLYTSEGQLMPPDEGASMTGFENAAMQTCAENVTSCVVLMFLDATIPDTEDKIVTGGCYDPSMAPWIISQEVVCEEGDDSVKVSLDGSFIYTCCGESGCNTGDLLDSEEARELSMPDCDSMYARDCVDHYAETYGCLLSNIRITKPGEDDECARFLRPGVSCLKQYCDACDCDHPDDLSWDCMKQCKGSMARMQEDYVAPGCYGMDIANGECDIFCMASDTFFDGGDCNGDGPGMARNHLLKLLAQFDEDMNGMLSMNESMYLYDPPSPEMFKKFDVNMNMGLDWYELGLFLLPPTYLDDSSNADEPLPTFMADVAINIMQLVDKDLDGRASKYELMPFGISEEMYYMMAGGDKDELTALELMKAFNIISNGLMGMDEIDKVDVKMASMIAVAFGDHSGDGMLSMGEAKLLFFSERMFKEIDEDGDGYISGLELYGSIKEAGKYGCMGYKHLDMQDGDIELKASPLRFPDSMCNILVMPEWNYEDDDAEYTKPERSPASHLRRKKNVRPRPPTIRNREQLHSLARRKAMLETKTTSPKHKPRNSLISKLLSPRHATRKLLSMDGMGSDMPSDPMMADPNVAYPFLVALQTPVRVCRFDYYLPDNYCAVAPWLVWDELVESGVVDGEGISFEDSCLSEEEFHEWSEMAEGPEGLITREDFEAKIWDDLEDRFWELSALGDAFPDFDVFAGPRAYKDFQTIMPYLFPQGSAGSLRSVGETGREDRDGEVCQQDTPLNDYWWSILVTGQEPERSTSFIRASFDMAGSGGISGSGGPLTCVPNVAFQVVTSSVADENGVRLRDHMTMFMDSLFDCSVIGSGSSVGSGSGGVRRRRLLSEPREPTDEDEFGDMMQYCSGTLIDKQWVLTAAFCVGDDIDDVIEHDQIRVGGKNATSGSTYRIEKVLVHPGFKIVGHEMWDMREFDAALIKLADPVEDVLPIRLYDGLDLGYSDCHQLMVKALGFPEMGERGAAELEWTPNYECDEEKMEELGYKGSVTPNMLCAINDDDGEDEPFMDLGGPLVAKPAELVMDVGYVLIGVTSTKEHQRHFFTRVSKIRQWVLSEIGEQPDKDMSVVINELELGDETHLHWFAHASHTAPCPDGMCEIEECDIETGVYRDMGNGALTFSIQGGGDWEVSAELTTMGCGIECDSDKPQWGCPREMEDEEDDDEEKPPACVPCTLTATWENITEMAKYGKSFTGGLGAKSVHTFHKQYGVWVCVRDWDVEEQLACGAKPGEIVCFRFNEKEHGTFDYYGMNDELMLVTEDQAMQAKYKQLGMLATLMSHKDD